MGISDDTLTGTESGYDRMKELKAFDETKAGVKGLVDAGVEKIPRIFVRPPEELAEDLVIPNGSHVFELPVINLEGIDKEERRREIVDGVRHASETWGFFQLVNHGVPQIVMEDMLEGTRRFHEQDIEVKKQFYTRADNKKVRYNSNFDLYQTKAANWRDSFGCLLDDANPEEIPEICRDIILEYRKYLGNLADTVIELFSEALGLKPDHLKSIACSEWCSHVCHYYPACPEPELTLGSSKHSDPSFLTVVLQDHTGGLQVLHQNHWVDVAPIPGALVINVGDLLQLVSNNKFKSAEHRVLASRIGPRTSVACFFRSPDKSTSVCGPLQELLSEDNPPVYKDIRMEDYNRHYITKGLDGIPALNRFKV